MSPKGNVVSPKGNGVGGGCIFSHLGGKESPSSEIDVEHISKSLQHIKVKKMEIYEIKILS